MNGIVEHHKMAQKVIPDVISHLIIKPLVSKGVGLLFVYNDNYRKGYLLS